MYSILTFWKKTKWYLKLPIVLYLNCNTQNSMLGTVSNLIQIFVWHEEKL